MRARAEMRTQQVGAGDSPARLLLRGPAGPCTLRLPLASSSGKPQKAQTKPRPLLTWGLLQGAAVPWPAGELGDGQPWALRAGRAFQAKQMYAKCQGPQEVPGWVRGDAGEAASAPGCSSLPLPFPRTPRSVPPPPSVCAGGAVRPLHVALFTEFQYRHVPAEDPGVPPGHVPAAASW